MPTPSMEDYIWTIYLLIEEKGYARVSDIDWSARCTSILCNKNGWQKLDKDDI